MTIDQVCRFVLMSAYLYYHRDESVISDELNDKLVQFLVNNWTKIPSRYIPYLDPTGIGAESISSSTYACKYSSLIEGGALAWIEKEKGKKLERLPVNVTPTFSIENLF